MASYAHLALTHWCIVCTMRRMKLSEYMKLKQMTDDVLADALGKDRTIIGKYRRGIVIPPIEVIARIEDVTERAVSFRDFLAHPPPDPA